MFFFLLVIGYVIQIICWLFLSAHTQFFYIVTPGFGPFISIIIRIFLRSNIFVHFFQQPVIENVLLMSHWLQMVSKKLFHIVIIRLFFKLQILTICKILQHTFWKPLTESLTGGSYFLFLDPLILISFGLTMQSLPRQFALQKVHNTYPNSLKVISPRLF